jgi:heat shock protein HslJ
MDGKILMHTKVKSFILIAALFSLLTSLNGQSPQKGRASTNAVSLQGKWYLQAVLPSDTSAGRVPEIIFDINQNDFSGNTGCNTMRGKVRITDSSIVFDDQIETTKMHCVGYNEEAFLKNLVRCDGYKIRNGMLILMVSGNESSRWSRQIIKPKKTLKT